MDTLQEKREEVVVHAEVQKTLVARRYNTKVRLRHFMEGDLVWRKIANTWRNRAHGKFAANWEGPFRVVENLKYGAYRQEYPTSKAIPNTWNATHFKLYFS